MRGPHHPHKSGHFTFDFELAVLGLSNRLANLMSIGRSDDRAELGCDPTKLDPDGCEGRYQSQARAL
jgi:hypothetical protein